MNEKAVSVVGIICSIICISMFVCMAIMDEFIRILLVFVLVPAFLIILTFSIYCIKNKFL